MADGLLYYWDANVFLSYLNEDPLRISTLEAILDDVLNNKKDKIVTSVLSKVEVAWVATEKINRALNQEEEARIDALWNDSSIIELVDFNDDITQIARSLLRKSMARGLSLKTNDAIHLATAEWVGASVMNTYDDRLYKFNDLIGIDIKAPVAEQPRLL